MRLLKLGKDGEISMEEFIGNKIPPYAILSHTWGADIEEVTFRDMVKATSTSKAGYQKIRFCGEQAKTDDLEYFWIDTCCIDKSSSTELFEAINSMFRWYQNADKCYAYLSDISINASTKSKDFRDSKWFTRGWTLQELIAPESVEFFSVEGDRLGDKTSLEEQIHEITGIPTQVLQGGPLTDFSTKERMSWAVKRQTKREEDAAYSLLGIFNVYMPLIYGEGMDNAFRRLREEIKRNHRKSSSSGSETSASEVSVYAQTTLESKSSSDSRAAVSKKRRLTRDTDDAGSSDDVSVMYHRPVRTMVAKSLDRTPDASRAPDPSIREHWPASAFLPLQKREFRILHLFPGRGKDKVAYSFSTESISQPPEYEAISYLFKPSKEKWPIFSEIELRDSKGQSHSLYIMSNLYSALQSLRHPRNTRLFWVEALCIKHSDMKERNEQTEIKRAILHYATSQCFWLGEDRNSKVAMAFVPKILDLAKVDKLCRDSDAIDGWTAFATLLQDEIFSRLWLVQTTALAQNVTLHSGHSAIHYDDLVEAVAIFVTSRAEISTLFRRHSKDWKQLTNRKIRMAELFVEVSTNALYTNSLGHIKGQYTLEMLISKLSDLDSLDPRDRIFSALTIANDEPYLSEEALLEDPYLYGTQHSTTLRIDYTKDVLEVYRDFVIQTVSRSLSLDIICRGWASSVSDESDKLPTWVRAIEFTLSRPNPNDRDNTTESLVGLPDQNIYNASRGSTIVCSLHPGASALLEVSGKQIDKISTLSARASGHSISSEWLKIGGCGSIIDLTAPPPHFWRILVADRGPDGSKVPSWYGRAFLFCLQHLTPTGDIDIDDLELIANMNDEASLVISFLKRIQSIIKNRKLFVSESNGWIGLAPAAARDGDIICILYGCSVPVVLRMQSPWTEETTAYYQLVGEAYVHGIMNGEGRAIENMDEQFHIH